MESTFQKALMSLLRWYVDVFACAAHEMSRRDPEAMVYKLVLSP